MSEKEKNQKKTSEKPKGGGKELKKNLKEIEGLKAELEESKQKFVRLFSEFDNFKKRTVKEKSDLLKGANEPIMMEMIFILDDFERAIEAAKSSESTEGLMDGVNLIYGKLKKSLEQSGMEAIETLGKNFDSDLHEAVSQMPAQSKEEKGKVIQEVEKGYLLNDKVIRYSKVVVGT